MHFEILVEDISGKKMLKALVPKIVDLDAHTVNVHSYKGKGLLPKSLVKDSRNLKRKKAGQTEQQVKVGANMMLNNLPATLRGFGKTFGNYTDNLAAVIVVCDLDKDNLDDFLSDLQDVLEECNPRPDTHFCLSIEEGEAWYLGDIKAVKKAYPHADKSVLKDYVNDSICGTWELLADAIYPGGATRLKQQGGQVAGREKAQWAKNIAPLMDVENNKSPSFKHFRDCLRQLAEQHT